MQNPQSPGIPRLWTGSFITLLCISSLTSIAMNMQMVTLPLYIVQTGGGPSSAGMMMGAFTIAALLFRPYFGRLVDRLGGKLMLVAGTAVFAVISLAYSVLPWVWALLLVRFIHGVGFSASSTASGTMLAQVVPPRRLMEGIGLAGLAHTLAVAVGPGIGLFFARQLNNYTLLYVITALLAMAAIAVAWRLREPEGSRPAAAEPIAPRRNNLIERSALPTSAVMFFIAMPQSSIITFLPAYGLEQGVGSIGLFFTFSAISMVAARVFCGKISDKHGPGIVIIPGFLLAVAALAWLPFIASLDGFIAAGVLHGLGFGTVQPILNALTMRRCPPERRGAGNATFFLFIDGGYAAGSILIGLLLSYTSYAVMYMCCAGLIVLALGLYIYLLGSKRERIRERNLSQEWIQNSEGAD